MSKEKDDPQQKVPQPLNLFQRLLKIMKEVGYVQKDGFNAFHRYKYVSESAIMDKLREACIEHGVVILPSVTKHERIQVPHAEGKDYPGDIVYVEVLYTIINADNPEDIMHGTAIGYGQDKGDKGVFKAMTGAYKYFALKTFQVSSGDDPENDGEQVNKKTGEVVVRTSEYKGDRLPIPPKRTIATPPPAQAAPATQPRYTDPEWSTFKYKYAFPKEAKDSKEIVKAAGAKFRGQWANRERTQENKGWDNCWYTNTEFPGLAQYAQENSEYIWPENDPRPAMDRMDDDDMPGWMRNK